MEQMQEELHDWLKLVQLAREVLRGLPSRLAFSDPDDAPPQTDSAEYLSAHGAGCKPTGAAEEHHSPPLERRWTDRSAATGTNCCCDSQAELDPGLPQGSPTAIDTSNSPGILHPEAHAETTARP